MKRRNWSARPPAALPNAKLKKSAARTISQRDPLLRRKGGPSGALSRAMRRASSQLVSSIVAASKKKSANELRPALKRIHQTLV